MSRLFTAPEGLSRPGHTGHVARGPSGTCARELRLPCSAGAWPWLRTRGAEPLLRAAAGLGPWVVALLEPLPHIRPQLSCGPLRKKGTRPREGATRDQVSRSSGSGPRAVFLSCGFRGGGSSGQSLGGSRPAFSLACDRVWLRGGSEASVHRGPWPPLPLRVWVP